jgi:hypothetical protein
VVTFYFFNVRGRLPHAQPPSSLPATAYSNISPATLRGFLFCVSATCGRDMTWRLNKVRCLCTGVKLESGILKDGHWLRVTQGVRRDIQTEEKLNTRTGENYRKSSSIFCSNLLIFPGARWTPEPFWTRWWREKFPALAGNRTLEPRVKKIYAIK